MQLKLLPCECCRKEALLYRLGPAKVCAGCAAEMTGIAVPEQPATQDCTCGAFEVPHQKDTHGCYLDEEGDDYSADEFADDPRRGQATDINRRNGK